MTSRWMLYVPEIEPDSFFFFFFRNQGSYSIRTYTSAAQEPSRRGQKHFPSYTADMIVQMAKPEHRVTRKVFNRRSEKDWGYWWGVTCELNAEHLGHEHTEEPPPEPPPVEPTPERIRGHFVSNTGEPLRTMADWQALHPQRHWRAGYSAMELARCWSSAGGLPPTFRRALASEPFQGLTMRRGVVEQETEVPGKGRASCTDLMVEAHTSEGTRVVLGVEGKVDESFGDLVSDWLARGGANRRARLEGLCAALQLEAGQVGHLRYQLFHRTYATLESARHQGAEHAVMAVHSLEGRGPEGDNWQAFVAFARALGVGRVEAGRPMRVGRRHGVQLWLMWVTEASASTPLTARPHRTQSGPTLSTIVDGLASLEQRLVDAASRGDDRGVLASFEAMVEHLEANLQHAPRFHERGPSTQNWRWPSYNPRYTPGHSSETDLEKRMVKLGHPEWGNQIPTQSGLVSASAAKHANIDLAYKHSARRFSLFELKTVSDNPATAAGQIVRYAALWVMSVRGYPQPATSEQWPLLLAEHLSLRVLAPARWYGGSHPRRLERALCEGLSNLSHLVGRPVVVDFAFEALPVGVDHESSASELVDAMSRLVQRP